MMLPRQYLGRRQHRALHARLHRVEQRHQRHQRLARPDIALQQPQHRRRLRHVALDLADRAALRAGRRKGQLQHRAQSPVALDADAPPPPRRLPHQHQRQLPGENLVIGQPLARLGVARIGMGAGQRIAPGRPLLAGEQAGLDPFGQVGRARQRLRRKIAHAVVGQTFREPIDRFARRHRAGFLGREDMVGMDDLKIVAIGLQLARDELGFVEREELARPAAVPAEVDERDAIAMGVHRQHAERRARAAAGAIVDRRQHDADDAPGVGQVEPVGQMPVDPTDRQVEGDVDRARQAQPLQRTGERGAYPLEQGYFGKERIENIGAHVYLTRSSPSGTMAQTSDRLQAHAHFRRSCRVGPSVSKAHIEASALRPILRHPFRPGATAIQDERISACPHPTLPRCAA